MSSWCCDIAFLVQDPAGRLMVFRCCSSGSVFRYPMHVFRLASRKSEIEERRMLFVSNSCVARHQATLIAIPLEVVISTGRCPAIAEFWPPCRISVVSDDQWVNPCFFVHRLADALSDFRVSVVGVVVSARRHSVAWSCRPADIQFGLRATATIIGLHVGAPTFGLSVRRFWVIMSVRRHCVGSPVFGHHVGSPTFGSPAFCRHVRSPTVH